MRRKHGLFESFLHAFAGIFACVKRERNMKIHFAFVILVSAGGFLFGISQAEWLVCLVFFALVLGAEAFNTAIEAAVDIASPEQNPKAKLAKDAAAGAVLLCSLMAAVAGCIIFLPKIWRFLQQFFM